MDDTEEERSKNKEEGWEKDNTPEKKVMQRKQEERNIEIKTLMIATYRESYTDEALKAIIDIIEQERPEKIIILKMIEEKNSSELVDANIGLEGKKDFLESVRERKKEQADKYAEEIKELAERFDIPSEVHLRKSDDLGEGIIDEFRDKDVDHVIIHAPKKGAVEKMMEGSIAEDVKKELETRKVTLLD